MTPRNFLFPLFASAVYLLAQITVQTNLDQRQQHALSFLISCNGNVGTNFFPQGDFGTGSDSLLAVDPGFAVDFVFSSSAPPPDGTLVYTNDTQPWNINPNWINTTDNGSEPMSYMMLINAAETTGVFFEQTFDVCENNAFEISADFINILNNTAPSNTNPDISFLINGLEIFSTGALPQDENWHTFATTYQTAVGEQDFTLQLRSNTIAANENVFAVDNIALRACGPDVTAEELNPTPHCPNDTLQLEINVGPDYSNPFIQWQISLDEGNNWTNFGSATTNNTLQIASVPYLARYRALVANADSNIVLNTCTIISNEVIPAFNDIDVCASSIVDLDDRCSGLRGENILPDGDFGSGQSNTLEFDPGFAPGYIYTTDPPPSDGDYTITNNTTSWGDFALNGWINTGDNSADPEGYMMVVNATVQPGAFFQRTVDVCENTNYEFSVDVINVVEPIGVQRIQPLVDFQIDGLTLYSTGNVPQDGQWHTYGFSFTTAPGVSEVTLTLLNNAPGGIGNDLALDNISFLACGPEVETGAVAEGPYCPGDPAEISIGIGPGLDDPIIQWQLSLDGGNNWENTGTPSTDTFLVINSLPYQAQYRALVAESEANLANIACSALSEPILFDFSPIEDCYTNPIAQTGPICNGLLGPELIPDGNFGSGVDTVGPALPAGVTTYNYTTDSFQIDGNYSILNQLYFDPGAGNFPDTAWIQLQDQSENPEDYFMLINADDQRGIFYQTEITGLCENTSYQFSADFINVLSRYFGPFGNFSTSILPDIDFVVAPVGTNRELLEAIPAAYNTGGILNDSTWHHHGFTFETQAGQTSVIVALRNHAGVGNGNDFVIDNVSLRTCFGQANVFINPICEGNSLTLQAQTDGNGVLQWQQSSNNGSSWTDIPGANNTSLLIPAPQQGDLYRIALAASADQLTNANCVAFSPADTVMILPTSESSIEANICEGEVFEFGGSQLTESGTYQTSHINISGCDSTVTLTLNVLDTIQTTIEETICQGESFEFGGSQLTESGTYQTSHINISGCDSIVTLTLNVLDSIQINIEETICQGETFEFGGSQLTESGTYQSSHINISGCDSTVTLTLNVLDSIQTTIEQTICQGEIFEFGGEEITESGTYQTSFISTSNCDSTVTLTLNVLDSIQTTIEQTICEGETFEFGGEEITESGTYQTSFISTSNCDSTVTLTLNVLDSIQTTIEETICQGETFEFGGSQLTESGTYQTSYINISGCDSTVTLTLNVLDSIQTTIEETICQGETFEFGGSQLTESGTYQTSFINTSGCDSTVTLTLNVLDSIQTTIEETICEGEIFEFGGSQLTESGTYQTSHINISGCDSTVTLTLNVNPVTDTFIEAELCPGDEIEIGGTIFDQAGSFLLDLIGENGCDSTVHIDIIPLQHAAETFATSICAGESIEIAGSIFSESGTYTLPLIAANGCDSILTVELEVLEPIIEQFDLVLCDGMTYNGQTFTADTLLIQTFTASNGCDSIVEANLMVSQLGELNIMGNTSLCQGNPTELSVGNFAAVNWSTGAQSSSIVAEQAGMYSVTVTDELGCATVASVQVIDEGVEAFIASSIPTCPMESDGAIFIDAISGGNPPYEIYIDGVPLDTNFMEGLPQGSYDILIVDQTGCEFSESVQINDPLPLIADLGPDQTLLLPDSLQLNVQVNATIDSVVWTPAIGLSCTDCLRPRVQIPESTTYQVTVFDENGCMASDEIRITVDRPRRIYVPNIFSPNGDGMNDIFSIQTGPEIQEIRVFKLFDRWGSQVWEGRKLSPQDATQGWNGDYARNGQEAPQGVYIYFAELVFFDGRVQQIKGDISLVR